MSDYPCVMCGFSSVVTVIDGTWRAAVCDDHRDATWDLWVAQRKLTHPSKPPRNY